MFGVSSVTGIYWWRAHGLIKVFARLIRCNNPAAMCTRYYIQGGPKVSLHTLGLIPTSCFILGGFCFADGILYLLVRGFRRQNLKIRISYTTPIQY